MLQHPHPTKCTDGARPICDNLGCHRCHRWWNDYHRSNASTLLIVNVGAHVHTEPTYRKLIGMLRQYLRTPRPERDVVLFRTTPPGHPNCRKYDRPPSPETVAADCWFEAGCDRGRRGPPSG